MVKHDRVSVTNANNDGEAKPKTRPSSNCHLLLLPAMSQTPPELQTSIEDVWYLKDIKFHGKELRIITQNFNGCVSTVLDDVHNI